MTIDDKGREARRKAVESCWIQISAAPWLGPVSRVEKPSYGLEGFKIQQIDRWAIFTKNIPSLWGDVCQNLSPQLYRDNWGTKDQTCYPRGNCGALATWPRDTVAWRCHGRGEPCEEFAHRDGDAQRHSCHRCHGCHTHVQRRGMLICRVSTVLLWFRLSTFIHTHNHIS